MNRLFSKVLPALIILAAAGIAPAMAKHDDNRDNHHNYYGHQQSHYNNRNNYNKHNQNNQKKYWKAQTKANRNLSWDQQRALYRSHWSKVTPAQRQTYDAQMRAQYRAYRHNQVGANGYGWNNYSDPAFLNYVHTSNPTLLQQLGGVLGIY